jgi:uncharacterized protein YaiE (UPF0345 family)
LTDLKTNPVTTGTVSSSSGAAGEERNNQPAIMEHAQIFEKNISEHFHAITGAHINVRTDAFRQWLINRPEENIVVVGHSAFFRDLIETDCKMDNCEVRQVLLDTDSGKFHSPQTLVAGGQELLKSTIQ